VNPYQAHRFAIAHMMDGANYAATSPAAESPAAAKTPGAPLPRSTNPSVAVPIGPSVSQLEPAMSRSGTFYSTRRRRRMTSMLIANGVENAQRAWLSTRTSRASGGGSCGTRRAPLTAQTPAALGPCRCWFCESCGAIARRWQAGAKHCVLLAAFARRFAGNCDAFAPDRRTRSRGRSLRPASALAPA